MMHRALWTLCLMSTLLLSACSGSKKITNQAADTKVVIVYYDATIGSAPLEKTIKKEHCEVVYRYKNFNAMALKISGNVVRKRLENTKGVLSVQDDRMLQLD